MNIAVLARRGVESKPQEPTADNCAECDRALSDHGYKITYDGRRFCGPECRDDYRIRKGQDKVIFQS